MTERINLNELRGYALDADQASGGVVMDSRQLHALIDLAEAAQQTLYWIGHKPRERQAEDQLRDALARFDFGAAA